MKSAAAGVQNTEKHLIAKPKKVLKEKAMKKSDVAELAKKHAYRQLRQAWVDKRYKGRREKRAKEEAEAKAAAKK